MADSSGASTRLRYASVCDGIGAAHVAWQPLGWQCQWTSEIEPFPVAVVEHHYGFRNLGDMTKITEDMIDAPVDLLVGGTPCQSFSVAGLRGGLADPRGNLALRFVQLAAVMQPRWVVWENVPGVLSSGKGRDFGTFLGALAELGYGFAYRILDAQWFGVAQRRRRVFVVGYLGDWRRAAAVLFERESVFGNPPTRGAKGEGITSSPQGIAGNVSSKWSKGTGGPAGDECYNLIAFGGQMSTPQVDIELSQTLQRKNPQAVAMTFDWQAGGGGSDKSFRGKSRSYIVDKPGSTRALTSCKTLAVAVDLQNVTAGGDLAGTLDTTRPSRGGGQAVAFKPSHYTRGKDGAPSEVAAPLSADADKGDQDTVVALQDCGSRDKKQNGKGWNADGTAYTVDAAATQGVAQPMAVRRLTPRECERLQGFPDDYTLVTYRGKPAADGPRYRALGNSMAVPVMRWIGERIRMVEGQ